MKGVSILLAHSEIKCSGGGKVFFIPELNLLLLNHPTSVYQLHEHLSNFDYNTKVAQSLFEEMFDSKTCNYFFLSYNS